MAIDLVFFGTPEFAVPALEALAADAGIRVLAVVTQPDAPSGRGQKLSPPPIKQSAEKLGLPVFQPDSIKRIELGTAEGKQVLTAAKPGAQPLVSFLNEQSSIQLFVCVAYGKLIPNALLTCTPQGMVNIHPSLLPRWRGAAPIQRSLFAGDRVTGVALMQIDEGLDSGPIYCLKEIPIEASDTSGSLHDRLAKIGAEMLVAAIPKIVSGELVAKPQLDAGVTYAEKWEREDCRINWEEDAEVTLRRIRTCNPRPGARTMFHGEQVNIYEAKLAADNGYQPAPPGVIVHVSRSELIVSAGGAQYIAVQELQFPGKKRLAVAEVLKGKTIAGGEAFV